MFDACIVEVGTPRQQQAFEALLAQRRKRGLYPRELDFRVVSDPEGGRVGSGGALLNVLALIQRQYGGRQRVFVVQAGGESRRMPCFVPEGKLFAPVPSGSSNLIPPVVLDLLLTAFLKYPWQEGETVLASGDSVVDFDPDTLTAERAPLCGFARLCPLEEGSRHGVFKLREGKGEVLDYYQKMPVDFLRENAAIDGSFCALDMGVVSLSRQALEAFGAVAGLREGGRSVGERVEKGELYFDLYLELLSAAIPDLSLAEYLQRMRGRSRLSEPVLAGIHGQLQPLRLRAALMKRSRFVHFGDLPEYLDSVQAVRSLELLPFFERDRAELEPESRGGWILSNSDAVSGPVGRRLFCESCRNLHLQEPGEDSLFVGLEDLRLDYPTPPRMCFEARSNPLGDFLLVYGVRDTWKPAPAEALIVCGQPLPEWLEQRAIAPEQVIGQDASGAVVDPYELRLWVPGASARDLQGYLDPRAASEPWKSWFLRSRRRSLREINEADDPLRREQRRMAIRRGLLRAQVLSGSGWRSITARDFLESFGAADAPALAPLAERNQDPLVAIYRRHLLDRLSGASGQDSIQELGLDYLSDSRAGGLPARAIKSDQIVWSRSPVRLDIAGGWTDTPPYTLREGGSVLNVAVDLNGQPPIQVFCRPIDEPVIRLHSIDTGLSETVRTLADLQGYAAAASAFALPKAALCLIGFSASASGSLAAELRRIGCGMEITLLCAIPKGSGLGTSSILAGTILSALHRFFGVAREPDHLFREVLQMEQMLTTGGGWQDQIGGLVGGVKFIQTQGGLKPRPLIYQLDPFLFEEAEASACFTLFYTGTTRLAKNILQEVVDGVNGLEPAYLFTIRGLKALSQQAREAISLRSLPRLAEVLNLSWRANRLIHPSTSNEEIEAMLADLRGRYLGMKLLGAGGGGYALFLSESPAQASLLRQRLRERHENDRARIVELSLNRGGLRVSVS